MLTANPSPLPGTTTDAIVVYGIFDRAKQREEQEKESPSFQATALVTFRLSTGRNVKRLVVAAAQVQLLKTTGLGRLTCFRARTTMWPCGAEIPHCQWKVSFIWL
jgi:hypothetical protein